MDPARDDFCAIHHVGDGYDDPFDVLTADLDSDGAFELVVWEKEVPRSVPWGRDSWRNR